MERLNRLTILVPLNTLDSDRNFTCHVASLPLSTPAGFKGVPSATPYRPRLYWRTNAGRPTAGWARPRPVRGPSDRGRPNLPTQEIGVFGQIVIEHYHMFRCPNGAKSGWIGPPSVHSDRLSVGSKTHVNRLISVFHISSFPARIFCPLVHSLWSGYRPDRSPYFLFKTRVMALPPPHLLVSLTKQRNCVAILVQLHSGSLSERRLTPDTDATVRCLLGIRQDSRHVS